MKFALFVTAERAKPIEPRYTELFVFPSDTVEIFNVYDGELPLHHHYDGVLITGSPHAAYDTYPWIDALCQYLRDLHSLPVERRPRLVGICFGHQVIAKALGGEVGLNPSKEFIFGTENITFQNEFHEFSRDWLPKSLSRDSARLYMSHGDCVLSLPPRDDAQLLATSPTCKVEMYRIGERTLAIQGHPEFTDYIMREVILPHKTMTEEMLKQFEELMAMEVDGLWLVSVINAFLRR